MWNKARLAYSVVGLALLIIGLPTIHEGIAGWAGWLHWLGKGDWQWALLGLGVLIIGANVVDLVRRSRAAPVRPAVESAPPQQQAEGLVQGRSESEPVPGEITVADLPASAAQAFAEMTRRRRIADLVAARVMKARELRSAFDEFIETFLTRRAQFVAGMTGEELERAREEYGRLQRRAARAYRAVRDHYRRFLQEEPQYDRSSFDPEDFVPEEPLPDWWQPLTFDAALDRYANADDEHLRVYIAEERAILEAFAEWISEPRHHELAGELAGANLEDEEIIALVQRQLAERAQAADDRQRLLDETAAPVTAAKEFIRRATPVAASVEWQPGDIAARLAGFDQDWKPIRSKLIESLDRHPSDEVQRLGNDLAEDVEKLLHGLRYLGNEWTDVAAKAAASASVIERHEHALGLVDELLKKIRAY